MKVNNDGKVTYIYTRQVYFKAFSTAVEGDANALKVVGAAYAAYEEGNATALLALFADDVTSEASGYTGLGAVLNGRYTGKSGFVQLLTKIKDAHTNENLYTKVIGFTVDGTSVVGSFCLLYTSPSPRD